MQAEKEYMGPYFYSSFFCLSLGGRFSSGAPGHCPPMPPSRYATVYTPSYKMVP